MSCLEILLTVLVVILAGALVLFDTFTENYKNNTKIIAGYEKRITELTEAVQKQNDELPKDCQDIQKAGVISSGVYTIHLGGRHRVQVWCDMETDGGGWTVFQQRMDGTVDFYRGWVEYELGFGNQDGEHWLGNQFLNMMTSQGWYELRIDLEDFDNTKKYAKYKMFSVGDLNTNYRLHINGYSGNAGDSMAIHNGSPFSTHDIDHDTWADGNCAVANMGAWWYRKCHQANLNGKYTEDVTKADFKCVAWNKWRGYFPLKRTTMMTRRLLL